MVQMFNGSVAGAAKRHALEAYPMESCGLVVNGEYRPCDNIAESPEVQFVVDPRQALESELHGDIQAVIHSHPNGPGHPTKDDILGQRKMEIPWALIEVSNGYAHDPIWWGPGVPTAPLIGRQFVYNVWDCFSLARDYYLQQGLSFPELPATDFEWWVNEPDAGYYVRGLASSGFRPISGDDLRIGDGFLAQIASKAVNHCGVYVGNGLILHHLQGALSRREPLIRWQKHIRFYVRHKGLDQ